MCDFSSVSQGSKLIKTHFLCKSCANGLKQALDVEETPGTVQEYTMFEKRNHYSGFVYLKLASEYRVV